MNVYLALTKGRGSDLERAVRDKGNGKFSLYKEIINPPYYKQQNRDYKTWYHRYISSFGDVNAEGIQKGKAGGYVLFFNVQTETQSPLVIGMGNPSVLETNLVLHPVYGTPYLPGTALKGLAAHYAHSLSDRYPELRIDASVMFGNQDHAGLIGFHDAWIVPESLTSSLGHDVITTHHPNYYESSATAERINAPRDDDSPTSIPFLIVQGCFSIVLTCDCQEEEARAWLDLTKTILLQALEDEGIGAKTSIGYGRMKEFRK